MILGLQCFTVMRRETRRKGRREDIERRAQAGVQSSPY